HDCRQPGVAPLGVDLSPRDERAAAHAERPLHPVGAADPAAAGDDEEELPEPGLVGTDGPARLDPHAVDVALAAPLAQRKREGSVALVHRDRRAVTGSEIKKAHILRSSRRPLPIRDSTNLPRAMSHAEGESGRSY